MKPIYECLDYLLNHLHENRFKPEGQRIPFDVNNKVIPELGLTTHEEFKGLIDMLIEDKNAFMLDTQEDVLVKYRTRVMILPRGIDFILKGGYTQKFIDDISERTRMDILESEQSVNRNWTLWLTVVLTVGTLAQAVYALTSLYWEHGWFQNLSWWLIVVCVAVSALTCYVVYRLLNKKLKQKQLQLKQ